MKLIHGGNLYRASQTFGITVDKWLDISTGISPWPWPVPPVPDSVWQKLPNEKDELLDIAAHYYGCEPQSLLAVPGSQYAIRQLPSLFEKGTVALPLWGYEEHPHAWQLAGHKVIFYHHADHLQQLMACLPLDYVVVINPNNPSTENIHPQQLLDTASQLAQHRGLLLVDEAFIDAHPENSLIPHHPINVIVLRSLGKFFGLAGVRLGFVQASSDRLIPLCESMNPWSVSHPARWIGGMALADTCWQKNQKKRLIATSNTWLQTLKALFPHLPWVKTPFFISATTEWDLCQNIYHQAGKHGLLLRIIGPKNNRGILRLGLPAEEQWQQALDILKQVQEKIR